MNSGLKSVQHMSIININDTWETPELLYKIACDKYGVWPEIDVCATDENHKCEHYFTKESDGLRNPWTLDSYGNFPYSKINVWIKRAWEQHNKHNINILILAFAKTDTKWWHKYVEGKAEVHFIEGRVRFLLDGKIPITKNKKGKFVKNVAPYPSCWIIYRSK